MTAERGVLYVATGARYVEAARRSAASLRQGNPGLQVALFTDQPVTDPVFDRVEIIDNPHARSKIDCLGRSPFCDTLFIDCDTRIVGDLTGVFRLLERFDLALALRPRQPRRTARGALWRHDVPRQFPEYNTGVILYRRTPEVLGFFRDWKAAWLDHGRGGDQITFRELLWASDLRLATLPREYNTRRYHLIDRLTWSGPPPVVLHLNRFHPRKGRRLLRRRRVSPLRRARERRVNPDECVNITETRYDPNTHRICRKYACRHAARTCMVNGRNRRFFPEGSIACPSCS
jgi:hypothetical protein